MGGPWRGTSGARKRRVAKGTRNTGHGARGTERGARSTEHGSAPLDPGDASASGARSTYVVCHLPEASSVGGECRANSCGARVVDVSRWAGGRAGWPRAWSHQPRRRVCRRRRDMAGSHSRTAVARRAGARPAEAVPFDIGPCHGGQLLALLGGRAGKGRGAKPYRYRHEMQAGIRGRGGRRRERGEKEGEGGEGGRGM